MFDIRCYADRFLERRTWAKLFYGCLAVCWRKWLWKPGQSRPGFLFDKLAHYWGFEDALRF